MPRASEPAASNPISTEQIRRWTCRYCGGHTIAPPVLRVLSSLYPDRFPFHPNWKAGQVHPAYLLLSTSLLEDLDHLRSHPTGGSRGGDPLVSMHQPSFSQVREPGARTIDLSLP